jgi:hypothetical protein
MTESCVKSVAPSYFTIVDDSIFRNANSTVTPFFLDLPRLSRTTAAPALPHDSHLSSLAAPLTPILHRDALCSLHYLFFPTYNLSCSDLFDINPHSIVG